MALLFKPRFRQALATWLALYPLLTLILWALADPLSLLPLPLRTLALTLFLVPWVTQMLNRCLPVPPPAPDAASSC
ncbi:MAG: hypothetical protein AAFV53_11475 [Myxococcota bacterium]